MRRVLFAVAGLLVLLPLKNMAQVPVDPDTKKIIYQEVVDETASKDTLYKRALLWVNNNFKNPQEVTRIRDAENGKVVGQHRIKMMDTDKDGNKTFSNVVVEYTFKIEAKENKYRISITDFEMKSISKFPLERWLDKKDPMYTPKWDDYLLQVDAAIKDVILSIKKGMKPAKVKSDEW